MRFAKTSQEAAQPLLEKSERIKADFVVAVPIFILALVITLRFSPYSVSTENTTNIGKHSQALPDLSQDPKIGTELLSAQTASKLASGSDEVMLLFVGDCASCTLEHAEDMAASLVSDNAALIIVYSKTTDDSVYRLSKNIGADGLYEDTTRYLHRTANIVFTPRVVRLDLRGRIKWMQPTPYRGNAPKLEDLEGAFVRNDRQ